MTLAMTYEGFRVTVDSEGIATVTMCKGDNTFTIDYLETWHRVLDDIERNPDVKGLITTGEGRAFSTGLDLKWLQKQNKQMLDDYHEKLHHLYKRILSLDVTTVAIINGHAFAEGAFIALMHDYRVMRKDRGWISWPEVHIKLPFTRTMLDLFRVKIPNGVAVREALVFGKRLDATNAQHLGIVDVVADEDSMIDEAKTALRNAFGKKPIDREFFHDMKSDIYNRYVVDEKLSKL